MSGCSPILAYQDVADLPVRDPGGHIDRLAGLVQRRSLFPRPVRPVLVVVPVPCQNSHNSSELVVLCSLCLWGSRVCPERKEGPM
jgi:hypothetical protein